MFRNAVEPWHLIVLLIVCLLVFGSKKLPDMARALGRSARILKSESRALRAEDDRRVQGLSGEQARPGHVPPDRP
jgi:sec-independent protein translocase protein TatA